MCSVDTYGLHNCQLLTQILIVVQNTVSKIHKMTLY